MHRSTALLISIPLLCLQFSGCASSPSSDNWLILERSYREQPEIVSVLRSLPSVDVRNRFPVLLEIAWGYRSQPNGLPTDDEILYGRTLYFELDRILGSGGLHAMTRTGDGGRTIYYYVSNSEFFREPIRKFFDSQPPISVKVSVRDDPMWATVRGVLGAVRQ